MFSRLFHQYSWNSDVGTTWKGLICWRHRTSIPYTYLKSKLHIKYRRMVIKIFFILLIDKKNVKSFDIQLLAEVSDIFFYLAVFFLMFDSSKYHSIIYSLHSINYFKYTYPSDKNRVLEGCVIRVKNIAFKRICMYR